MTNVKICCSRSYHAFKPKIFLPRCVICHFLKSLIAPTFLITDLSLLLPGVVGGDLEQALYIPEQRLSRGDQRVSGGVHRHIGRCVRLGRVADRRWRRRRGHFAFAVA